MTSQADERPNDKITVVGESHSLPFDGLTAQSETAASAIAVQSHFLPKVVASNVTNDESELHPHLITAVQKTEKRAPLALSFGDVEIHTKLLIRLAETYDFELPQRPDFPVRPAAEAVPLSTITSFLEEIFAPLRRGIQGVRASGFDSIVLRGLPARAECDKRASYWTKSTICPLGTRIKVTQHANGLLKSIAEDENASFVDVWNETSVEGVLDPKYDLDGVHTTADAAQITIGKIVELCAPRSARDKPPPAR